MALGNTDPRAEAWRAPGRAGLGRWPAESPPRRPRIAREPPAPPNSSAGATTPAAPASFYLERGLPFPGCLTPKPHFTCLGSLPTLPGALQPQSCRTLPGSGADVPAAGGGPAVWPELAAASRCCRRRGRSLSKALWPPLCIIHSDGHGALWRVRAGDAWSSPGNY